MAKGMYVGVSGDISTFEVYDYIESHGVSYLDTGYKPNNTTRLLLDINLLNTSGIYAIFGARDGNSTGVESFVLWQLGATSFRADWGTKTVSQTLTPGRYIFERNGNTATIGDVTFTNTASTFQCDCSLFLGTCNNAGTVDSRVASIQIYSCQIYDNDILVRDYKPCRELTTNKVGLYDSVNGTFISSTTTVEFELGTSTGETFEAQIGTARKIINGFVGISNKARQIKKAYIGIGGVARLCFGGGKLNYYGTITKLNQARATAAATSVGNYALFGGGDYGNTSMSSSKVDAYDKSLTAISSLSLSNGVRELAAASIGGYALFGGGRTNNSTDTNISNVDAYDELLTRTVISSLSVARHGLKATSIENYALFGGGSAGSIVSDAVDAYDKSLTRTIATALVSPLSNHAATSVGNYAIFAYASYISAYNNSLTRTIPTSLSIPRNELAAAYVGNHALFVGGYRSGTYPTVVDVYNTSLVRTTTTNISTGRNRLSGTSVMNYALFGGGNISGEYSDLVDAYEESLTRTVPTSLNAGRSFLCATSVGNYALFGGGYAENGVSSIVDAYVVI